MSRRRPTGLMNRFWMILAAVIALPLLFALLVIIVINPNDYKPEIESAVKSATGRELKINGDIQIGFGFSPTIVIHQIDLANPPGFSRNSMATIGSIQADIALFPLLFSKLKIGKLSVNDADIQVELNPLGKINTDFSKPAAETAATSAKPAESGGNPADKLQIGEIGIYGGRFAIRDDTKARSHELRINRVVVHSESKTSPVTALVDVEYDGTPVAFNAETGPVERLLGQGDASMNWPVKIDGTSTGTQFTLVGSLKDPLAAKGYTLDASIGADDLSALSGLAGGKLPPIHNLRASFHLSDAGGVPDISAVVLRAETSDLSSYIDGLTLDRIVLTAPATDQPIHAEISGRFSLQPLDALLDIGAPRAMIRAMFAPPSPNAATQEPPITVAISSHVAGAELSVKGQIANPAQLSGLTASVEWQAPDLSALSALVGGKLPAVKNLSFGTDISDINANGERGFAIHNIGFDSSVGDIKGDLDLIVAPRRAIRGKLASKRMDVDALQAAMARADNAAVAARPASAPVRPRAASNVRGRMIPDTPIDFSGLRAMDADLSLTVAELRLGGVAYRDLNGHAVLADGKLKIDPFQAALPEGRMNLKLGVDSNANPPELSAVINAPGVALKPLLQAAGQPDDVTGTVDIGADLVASGRTARQLAASLTGRLGVAMADAELDNRMFGSAVADVVRVAHLPADALVGGSGSNRTRLRCFAVRIDSVRGLAQLSAMAIQTNAAQVSGAGTINLGEEQLGLRLRPALRTPGVSVVVPVRVVGSLADPQTSIDAGISAEGVANSVAGGISSLARNPLGALTGAATSAVSSNDPCPSALASARAAMPDSK